MLSDFGDVKSEWSTPLSTWQLETPTPSLDPKIVDAHPNEFKPDDDTKSLCFIP